MEKSESKENTDKELIQENSSKNEPYRKKRNHNKISGGEFMPISDQSERKIKTISVKQDGDIFQQQQQNYDEKEIEYLEKITPKNRDVLEFIEEIFSTYSFKDAQIKYFDKHCKSFENPEENKDLYHDLFQEYNQILDDLINKKLEQKYSETEIQEFYQDFKQNYKKYEGKSIWLCNLEILFTFTDFENFKQTMIDYYERQHKGKVNEQQAYQKLDVIPDFDTFHSYFLKPTSEYQIILKAEKEDEANVYTKYHNNSVQVTILKYTLKGVEEDILVNNFFKMDFEKMKEAMPYFKELKEVQVDGEPKSDNVQTVYCSYEFPMMPFSDSLTRTEKSSYEDYKLVRQISIEHEQFPVKEGCKRTEMYQQMYCRQINGIKDTEVIDITFSERDQSAPPMFMVLVLAKATQESLGYFFGELRSKQAEKDGKQ